MIKKTIQVEVAFEADKSEPGGVKFIGVSVPGKPLCPLPTDVPAPRRLLKDLLEAAAKA